MTDSARRGRGNAKEGETVRVVLNRVKADKLDVHRHFVLTKHPMHQRNALPHR